MSNAPPEMGPDTAAETPPNRTPAMPPDTEAEIPAGVLAEIQVAEDSTEPKSDPAQPYIAFDHVSKAFGPLVVLDDVSFFVMAGETLCILGRSGVGKSVSLQQIMGFLKPDSGAIMIGGNNIVDYTEGQLQALRKKVTMVFQSGALFDSLSVGENVAFPLRERGELMEDQIEQVVNGLLDMVGVAGMAHLLPSDLSTGMKRSVAIARALASQPEAVLYDEPTTMVDPLMGRLLGDLIKKLRLQLHLTSIVVTHDMRSARRVGNRVLMLHEKKIYANAAPEKFFASSDAIVRQFVDGVADAKECLI